MKQRADALFAQYTRTSGELIEQYNAASDAGPTPGVKPEPRQGFRRRHRAIQRAPEAAAEVPVGAKALDHHGQGLLFIDDDAPCYVRVVGPDAARRLALAKHIAKNLTFANAPMTPRPFHVNDAARVERRSELSAQIALAVPLAAQQLGFQLMGTVDAALLGHYSDTALAAAGVGNNLLFAITSIGLGIVMGLDTVIPQALGAGRREDARRCLHAGLRLAVLVGLAATALVLATPVLLAVADVPPEVAREARLYVYLRALGVVPFLLSVALRSYLAARDMTRPLLDRGRSSATSSTRCSTAC